MHVDGPGGGGRRREAAEVAALVAWLEARGGRTGLAPWARREGTDGGDDEQGLCAVTEVRPGDVVLSMPLATLLTPAAIATRTQAGRTLCAQGARLSGAQWLTAFLALVRSGNTAAVADMAEHWGPYVATLPDDFAHCPGHSRFPPAVRELAQCLHPTVQDLLAGQDRARTADLSAVASALDSGRIAPAPAQPWQLPRAADMEWAWWAVNTRSIACTTGDAGPDGDQAVPDGVALAPYLDLLNHDPVAHTDVTVNHTTRELHLRSDHASSAGREFFICYGDHSNSRLWVEYGFVVPGHPLDPVAADAALDRLVQPSAPPPLTGGAATSPTSATGGRLAVLLQARQAAWARVQSLGLARDLGWAAGSGEPSWTLWRVVVALAWAELATAAAPKEAATAAAAVERFLLGEEDERVPPQVTARANALLHAMATFLLARRQQAADAARALPDSTALYAQPLWRWHADQVDTLTAALAKSARPRS